MRALLLLAAAALAACASPPAAGDPLPAADVTLGVEPETVAPGGQVTLVLRNGTSGALGYNLCTGTLERNAGTAWQPVPWDRVCTMELRSLDPGEAARYPLDLPAEVGAGEYRYRTDVERMPSGARESVASEPFQVMP